MDKIRRHKKRKELINDIIFSIIGAVLTAGVLIGMFAYWLMFGYVL